MGTGGRGRLTAAAQATRTVGYRAVLCPGAFRAGVINPREGKMVTRLQHTPGAFKIYIHLPFSDLFRAQN